MKRRIYSILASAALTLLALTACSSGVNNTETSTEAQSTVAQSSVAENTKVAAENTTNAVVVESVAKNKVYVSPQWVESLINGEQEESMDYVILECSWVRKPILKLIRRDIYPVPCILTPTLLKRKWTGI